MTMTNVNKAPFPWFGGKSKAAAAVWDALGDVAHYVEPFFGSGAVLLNRPHPANRPRVSETVNDLDGFVVNFWRAVQWHPDATAEAASWPVTEADKTARQLALIRWRDAGALERLAGDAVWCDPVMAGWWAWAVCVQIGAFDTTHAWIADPLTGVITKQDRGPTRQPGVQRSLPHVTNNGQALNHPDLRAPGVQRSMPHVTDDGRAAVHADLRAPGVLDPTTAAHGMSALDDWGASYHDRTMSEMIRWFRHLSARLRHVRVLNGDWSRLTSKATTMTFEVRFNGAISGVFLDPPYASYHDRKIYAHNADGVADEVRQWCLDNGDDPKYRIVLAGFDTEHVDLIDHGWVRQFSNVSTGRSVLSGGYKSKGGSGQMHRDCLWLSPHCLRPADDAQLSLMDAL